MSRTAGLFVQQFLRSPHTVGALVPSSVALARLMLSPIDFATVRTLVEFGPGTGAFTREIAARLPAGCRYLGIELNPRFVHSLSVAFPGLAFVHGSVADLAHILGTHRVGPVAAIVSGLPWATLPITLQEQVFGAMDRALTPGGLFVTFGYLQSLVLPGAQALRRRLHHSFAEVRRSRVVWGNVPPAFAYICRKGA
ncbi:MAG TPA: methyltransferase domain-containing protein [Acetobacteraceae bacterium]|nr:methyltransferase domain-containing protein [Acetobacteraceae bacterium]